MTQLTKAIATELINSGGYLGQPPKFDVGDVVVYRLANFSELGFYPESEAIFGDRQFKIIDMQHCILGLPIMDIAWEYTVSWHPMTVSNCTKSRTFLEPQLALAMTSKQ
ncbi:hypothetical protein COO91_02025 [Nostoc flagelliforme CCNUN1]|uniref:Uncharacterized protein n=1 Tax=Nostoc flagelliforme CCNUN1 TaxID=2038116 RepID=A0A2K8SKX7_9NOSO|nr:hypothetical protein [Nostoc flagelliforme]AUB36124.1 hypothetical protein COO91_02025 [Nostoc flagelliforme CCNUN1]